MALSDRKILEKMAEGKIIIEPFVRENLSTSSYDMTLGEFYYREHKPRPEDSGVYNIWNLDDTKRVWGEVKQAKPAKEYQQMSGISPDDKIIFLAPGETILAHTNEFIGGRDSVTTMMKARSSMGRVFIEVCKCAGWGDVGYVNRWTMEISNNSQFYAIPLVVGRRISQMVFFETGEILAADYTDKGKYSSSTDLDQLKKDWKPEMMLPRLDKDRDIRV